jgi:hypothetical protein
MLLTSSKREEIWNEVLMRVEKELNDTMIFSTFFNESRLVNISDDEAIIQLVDSNIQRENILPSERAKAYKMRMEAMKRQGARTDLTSPNISAKFRSDDELG